MTRSRDSVRGRGDERSGSDRPRAAALEESTVSLLARIRQGDARAREQLLGRYLPVLRLWVHGRLPAFARDRFDTDDLVQVTLSRTLNHLETFEPVREGAFLAYLRRVLKNQILEEIRRVRRMPGRGELPDDLPDPAASPLELAVGSDTLERFERGLARLSAEQQEAVVLRVEMGFSYRQIAEALDRPTENAARMLVARALARLAREIHEHDRE